MDLKFADLIGCRTLSLTPNLVFVCVPDLFLDFWVDKQEDCICSGCLVYFRALVPNL